jgi:hypothetical protein
LRLAHLRAAALILAVGTVELGRAMDFTRGGAASVVAHGERRWHKWAYRRDDLPALFARVRVCLRDGDTVALIVPHGLSHGWWQVMALYYLPEHRLAGVFDIDDRTAPPSSVRVRIDRRGGVHVARPTAPC